PMGEIAGDLEVDRHELDAAHFTDIGRETRRPAARLPAEDHLQRLPLALVGLLVDVEAHRDLALAEPEIAFELPERDEVQPVELDVAELSRPHMPGEHALAMIAGRRLRKFAGAGNVTAADVEPVAGEPPLRNRVHGFSS